jgi:peptidyl-tRNA hydrolase
MSNPVMYILANKGAGMSAGKLAAQVAHAAVRAYIISTDNPEVTDWLQQGETKIVLECRDDMHLLAAQKYIEGRGYQTYLIVDEGRTEIDPHTPTALGVEIVDKADRDVAFTFSDFKTYKDKVRVTVDIDR